MGVSYDPDINTVEEKLGALANEFFERAAAGDMPDVERFANEHPEFADLIREVFPTLATFGEQDDSADVPGTLGDFQIIRQIGRGGMGIVYEAKQLSMGRRVAIKVLPFASMVDPKPLARFRNEVRAVGTLEHPHIVSVYSVGQERGIHYFAMQLIRGQSMAAVIQELRAIRESDNDLSGSSIREIMDRSNDREKLHTNEDESANDKHVVLKDSLRDTSEQFNGTTNKIDEDRNYYCNVARLGIHAADALAHAHEHGIIHRDIKPANLMLDAHGQLYVTDFGLARIESAGVTMSHDWLGTPRYMSPEQSLGTQVIDQRSDIYSLGVTLYELLTLQQAFAASDRQTLMAQIANEEPKLPRSIDALVPKDLETIILKAIRKDREDRYVSADELADDLRRFMDDRPIMANPPTTMERVARWSRQHKTFVRASLVLMLFLTIGLAVSTFLIDRERRRANEAASRERDQKAIAVNERNSAVLARDKEQEARESAERALDLFVSSMRSPDPARDGRSITVAEVLKQAESQIKEVLMRQPLEKARLLRALGETYLGLGLYPDAIVVLEEASSILEDIHGNEHPDTLDATNILASTFLKAGREDEAIELYERTLEIRKVTLGDRDPATLSLMNNLGVAYLYVRRYDTAVNLNEKALKLREEIHGIGHPDTATTMNNLASAYRLAGRIEEAVRLHEKSLTLIDIIQGEEPPEALEMMRSAADSYRAARRFDDAIGLYERTLARQRAILPDNHPETLTTMGKRADAYLQAGRYDKAFELMEETLELKKATLGEDDHSTLTAMTNLANAYYSVRRFDEALHLHEQTFQLRKAKLSGKHPDTLDSMNNLSVCLISVGRYNEAIDLIEETLKLKQAVDGERGPDKLQLLNNLASAYSEAGRNDEAIEVNRKTLKLLMESLGEKHFRTLITMNNLAGCLDESGRHDEAIGLYEKTLEIRKANLRENDPNTILSMSNLASSYSKVGRHEDAIKLRVDALKLARQQPSEPRRLSSALASLALCLVEQQDFEAAESHARECVEIRKEIMPDHWLYYNAVSVLGAALVGQGKKEVAEALLLNAYQGMHQRRDKIPRIARGRIKQSLERIVKLYEDWNKPEEAAEWKHRLDDFDAEQ